MSKHVLEIPNDVLALPISELGGILAGAMYDAESDDENEGIRHACVAMEFDDVIQKAVRSGELQPRAFGTCLPMSTALPSSVVTVQDLAQFLADIQCGVQILRIEASPAQPQAAAPAPVVSSPSNAPGKVWTDEKLAEVSAYRLKHGTKKTAEHYGVSEALIRKKLPGEKSKPKGYSAFTHRPE